MIRMCHTPSLCPEEGGISYPVLYCSACNSPIKSEAVASWNGQEDNRVFFYHKGHCDRSERRTHWVEFSDCLTWLYEMTVRGLPLVRGEESSASKFNGKRRNRKSIGAKRRYDIFKRDGFTCRYCGRKPPEVKLHLDHVTPLANGGSDSDDNLVTACSECNIGKGATV